MKKVVGKTEVEDALEILDLLTKEENFTTVMTRNPEDTYHFDDEATIFEEIFQDVRDDVRAAREVFCDVGSDVRETNVDVIKQELRSVNDDVKATDPGMPYPFNFFHLRTDISLSCVITVTCGHQCW
jgi:hypothetical protein